MDVLTVKNLHYTFPGAPTPFLKEISFSLREGEFVLLYGSCGSGKSTLLKCLNGVIPHLWQGQLEGEVIVGAINTAALLPERLSREIGTVWQDVEAQILHQEVEEELVFGMENLALKQEEMERRLSLVLPLVGLPRRGRVSTLSGGQKQRLVVGAVLCMLPDILLLDEPLANLDRPGTLDLLVFLQKLCREEGKTVLMVEHRLDLALPFVSRVMRLEEGCLVENRKVGEKKPGYHQPKKKPATRPLPGSNSEKNDSALCVKGLSVRAGEKQIINSLDLELNRGESLVLLGNNGSGKTTLLKVLAGLSGGLACRHHDLSVFGVPYRKASRGFLRSTMGYVLQNPNHQLFMDNIYRELAMGAASEDRAEQLLDLFGLHRYRHCHPFSLSQGQKRLLALAAVLARKPRLLLLDEPTIGQDESSLETMLSVLLHMQREEGLTLITATHDHRAALELSERVMILCPAAPVLEGDSELVDTYFPGSFC